MGKVVVTVAVAVAVALPDLAKPPGAGVLVAVAVVVVMAEEVASMTINKKTPGLGKEREAPSRYCPCSSHYWSCACHDAVED